MPRPALFLDRDGIINFDRGYVYRIEDFHFRDGIFELCAAAQAQGLVLVIVTNQAGIGRGYYTEDDFHTLTAWMLERFSEHGIRFAGVEFCPDHPVHGIGPYRRETIRRKPGPGMILDACAAHGLEPARSTIIGDRATDMQAGAAAGLGRLVLLSADAAEAAASPPGTIMLHEGALSAVIPLLASPLPARPR